MTDLFLSVHRHDFVFPAPEEPSWSGKVERWYQLDAAAYGLVETYSSLREKLGSSPDMIVLASPLASNVTDRSFALSGATSPSKFVHTLPNVRGAPLLQVMEWGGPVLCIQDDPRTVITGLDQAIGFLETDPSIERAWVLTINENPIDRLSAFYFVLSRSGGPIRVTSKISSLNSEPNPTPLPSIGSAGSGNKKRTDADWLDWVCTAGPGSFSLSSYYKATK
jgi:hypothetical protein